MIPFAKRGQGPDSLPDGEGYWATDAHLVLVLAGLLSAGACGGAGNQDAVRSIDSSVDAPTEAWNGMLNRLAERARDGTPYSLAFFGSGPNDVFLRAAIVDDEQGTAPPNTSPCERLTQKLADQTGGNAFWLLKIETSLAGAGVFPVASSLRLPGRDPHGAAQLQRVEGGRVIDSHTALGGEIRIDSAPATEDAFREGLAMKGSARLEFPFVAVEELECEGGSIAGDAPQATICRCRSQGQEYTCVAQSPTDGCCHDLVSSRLTVETTIQGARCPVACIATAPSLLSRCRALGNGS
jgi:hypothetical protein